MKNYTLKLCKILKIIHFLCVLIYIHVFFLFVICKYFAILIIKYYKSIIYIYIYIYLKNNIKLILITIRLVIPINPRLSDYPTKSDFRLL